MAKAQSITDMAFAHILKTMTPTMTEIEVALELEFFMRKNGADGLAFETIAVSGSASALPHGKPRNIPLQKGFLTMDYGASYNGYCSDMTRTIVIGKADADMKHLYETVLSAQRQLTYRKAHRQIELLHRSPAECRRGAGHHIFRHPLPLSHPDS